MVGEKRTFFGENWTFLVPKKGGRTRRRRRELQIDRVRRRWEGEKGGKQAKKGRDPVAYHSHSLSCHVKELNQVLISKML